MAGEERSDAPGRASADPRSLEDWSPTTQIMHLHVRVHFPDSLSERRTAAPPIRRHHEPRTASARREPGNNTSDIRDEVVILVVLVPAAEAFADVPHAGDEFDRLDPLHLLVTKLVLDPKPQRGTMQCA